MKLIKLIHRPIEVRTRTKWLAFTYDANNGQNEIGAAIAVELQGKIFAPFHDLYGNVATLVSPSDHTCANTRYTVFGEEEKPQSLPSPWRFSSKRTDDETHLVYFGRRYYTARG